MTWRACSELLIGRAAELEFLEEALHQAVTSSSRSRLGLVTGEAGVGKSRLVREVAERAAESGSTVLMGRSLPGGDAYRGLTEALAGGLRDRPMPEDPALLAYLPALGNLLPELATARSSIGGRVVLGEAVLRMMAALAGPRGTVLVLEDTHWADPDSLDILTYLTHAAGDVPLFLLLTARSESEAPAQLLDLVSCSAPVVTLEGLPPAQVRDIIECCVGSPPPDELVDFIVEHADGIPFLVEELLSGLSAVGALDSSGRLVGPLTPNVPRTFAATVRQRLQALDPASRRVVEAAAVLGRRFNWRLLPAMTGVSEPAVLSALRTVVDSGLALASEADSFRFRHVLTRDAVRAQLLPPEQVALARAAAEAVERVEPESYELAAELWAVTGENVRAAGYFLRAAVQARARAALHTADLLLGQAVRLADPDAELRRRAECELLEVLATTGDVDRALSLGNALLAVGAESARLTLAEVAAEAGRPTVAVHHLSALAEESPRASVVGARIAYSLGDPNTARDIADRALLAARESELWSVACDALQVRGRAARLTDLAEAEAAFAEAEKLARTHSLPVERMRALQELGTICLLIDGSIDQLLATRALAVEAGLLALTATVDVQIAAALLHRDPEEAMSYAERCARIAQGLRMDLLHATALFFCATVSAHRRDTEAMERCITEALAMAPEDLDVNAGIWGAARAHVALLADDLDALAMCLDIAVGYLRRSASTTPAPTRGLWALVRTVQDRDGAAARAEAARSIVNWENRALLGYAEAVAAGRRGDQAAAERAFAAADAPMSALPWWQHRIRLLVASDAVTDGWGEPVRWAHEAWVVFQSRGDNELVTRCRAVFAQAGVPIRRNGRGDSAVPAQLAGYGITRREMDVLALAGEGLTKTEIADRLVLSPKTVESHLSHLRRKTGTLSRNALIALLK
ncbi:MAG: AAA family ATPase [Frankiaceae bacterium]